MTASPSGPISTCRNRRPSVRPELGQEDLSLSRERCSRAADLWHRPGIEEEKPYFVWLITDLPVYSPTTLNLKTNVHTRPIGERPYVELEPTDRPLAVEQRTGITPDRVRQIAAAVFHPSRDGRQA
ncbi:DUF2199 domain-containing protein [Streptomyces sp. NPDC056501]|uniref:DUF2199 domain-containing protein n=1 Tax=Streptomyces sp. NPDC056501 TaxID=3345841 RepID=UPI0036809571